MTGGRAMTLRVYDRSDADSAISEIGDMNVQVDEIEFDEKQGVWAVPFGGTYKEIRIGPILIGDRSVSTLPRRGVLLVTGVVRADVAETEGTGGGWLESIRFDPGRSHLAIRACPDPHIDLTVRDDFRVIVAKCDVVPESGPR